jgi:hypothetical protein
MGLVTLKYIERVRKFWNQKLKYRKIYTLNSINIQKNSIIIQYKSNLVRYIIYMRDDIYEGYPIYEG